MQDIVSLSRRIEDSIASVIPDILKIIWQELVYRFDIVHVTNGTRIEVWCYFPEILYLLEQITLAHILCSLSC
jgi:hypothetical protein